jgi:hypothetical protein
VATFVNYAYSAKNYTIQKVKNTPYCYIYRRTSPQKKVVRLCPQKRLDSTDFGAYDGDQDE